MLIARSSLFPPDTGGICILFNTQQNSLYTMPSSCLRLALKPFRKEMHPTPHPHPARRNVVQQTPRFVLPARTTWRGPKAGWHVSHRESPSELYLHPPSLLNCVHIEVQSCGGGPEDEHLFEIKKKGALYSARHKHGKIKVGKHERSS